MNLTKKLTAVLSVLCLAMALTAWGGPFENQADKEKLYKEIAGSFEFETPEGARIIKFWAEEGVMYAQAEGETEVVELEAVEDNPLAFETTDEGGEFYEVLFARDDDGKINTCVITVQGMEFEGVRIKE